MAGRPNKAYERAVAEEELPVEMSDAQHRTFVAWKGSTSGGFGKWHMVYTENEQTNDGFHIKMIHKTVRDIYTNIQYFTL